MTGQAYKFKAIVHKGGLPKKEGTPSLKDEVIPGEYDPDPLYESETYVIYPFDFDPKKDENIVTRIENVTVGNGEVKSVKYVNVAGIVSDRPFEGVNIVVTEYTDGSHTTTKMLRK